MAFSIKNDEADLLLRELTALTRESLTEAVIVSVRERLHRERRRCHFAGSDLRTDPLWAAIEHFCRLPVIDDRTEDEILGYGSDGLPT